MIFNKKSIAQNTISMESLVFQSHTNKLFFFFANTDFDYI